jgi:hypothetical protein
MAYSSLAAQKNKRGFLDPRVKLALVILLAFFVMGGVGGARFTYVRIALSVIPFALLLVERQWQKLLRVCVMVIVGYGCLLATPYVPGVLHFIALMCGYVFTRLVITVAMGEYVTATTSVSEFIAAMEKMHVPQAIIVPMSVMFRMVPTIGAEWKSICRAMTMRGLHVGSAGIEPLLEYQLIPMISSSVRIGEELSAAALTRGLGAPGKRTNICQIGFRAQDWLLMLVSLAVIIFWLLTCVAYGGVAA